MGVMVVLGSRSRQCGGCTCVVLCQANWVSCLIMFLQRTGVGGFPFTPAPLPESRALTATWQKQLGEEGLVVCTGTLLSALLFPHCPLSALRNLAFVSHLLVSVSWAMCVLFCCWFFCLWFFPTSRVIFFAVLIHPLSLFQLETCIEGGRGEAGDRISLCFCWCICPRVGRRKLI